MNHELFATMLNELCALLKPRLTIMDAVIGMEGNGPGSGDPRQIGVVIAGRDPVAVDVVSSSVLGVSLERLPLIRAAAAAGYGETQLDRIRVPWRIHRGRGDQAFSAAASGTPRMASP